MAKHWPKKKARLKHWEDWDAWRVDHGIKPSAKVEQGIDSSQYVIVYVFALGLIAIGFVFGAWLI